MDDESDDQNKHNRPNYLRPQGIFSPLVVDYYNRFGHGRELEQYFSLVTASPESDVHPVVFNSLQEETNYITLREHQVDQPNEVSALTATNETITKDHSVEKVDKETEVNLIDLSSDYDSSPRKISEAHYETINSVTKQSSPTGSLSSHRKLEWDSLADVGYDNERPSGNHLSSIEKMALKHRFKDQQNSARSTTNKSDRKVMIITDESLDFGKPTAQSTPLSTSEPSPEYPTVINKKKSILKTPSQNKPRPHNMSPSKSQKRNKSKERLIREEMRHFFNVHKHQQPNNINVNLTKHYNLNLGFDRHEGFINPDETSNKEQDIPKNMENKLFDSENIPSEVFKRPSMPSTSIRHYNLNLGFDRNEGFINPNETSNKEQDIPKNMENKLFDGENIPSEVFIPPSMPSTSSKEIQTNFPEHTSTSVQTSKITDNETDLTYYPSQTRSTVTNVPFILNIKSPKSIAFKLPRRRPLLRVVKPPKEAKNNDPNPKEKISRSFLSTSKQPMRTHSEGLLSRADSFEYMPGHMYEVERSQRKIPTEVTDTNTSTKLTTTESSRHVSTSSNNSDLHKDETKRSMRQDLEKSVSLLNKILDAHHKDAALKKQLVKNVVKRLLKTRYAEDDSSSDMISGLSFRSSKLGMHEATNSSRSTSSLSNLHTKYEFLPQSENIKKVSYGPNTLETRIVIPPQKINILNKYFNSDSTSSHNNSSDRSGQKISFLEWMQPKTKSEKKYMEQWEQSRHKEYLAMKNKLIARKMSSTKLATQSSKPTMEFSNNNLQNESSQPVFIDEQVQIGTNNDRGYLDSSLNREITQLTTLQGQIKKICVETGYTDHVPKITSLLNDVVMITSKIAKRKVSESNTKALEKPKDVKSYSPFTLSVNVSPVERSPTEVPPLNLIKSSDESSIEVSNESKETNKLSSNNSSNIVSHVNPPQNKLPVVPDMIQSSTGYPEYTDGDMIDRMFIHNIHPGGIEEKKDQVFITEESSAGSYKLVDLGDISRSQKKIIEELRSNQPVNELAKSTTLPNMSRTHHPPPRNTYTLGNMNPMCNPERKIDLNVNILSSGSTFKNVTKTTQPEKDPSVSPIIRSQNIQTEENVKKCEQSTNTDISEKECHPDVNCSSSQKTSSDPKDTYIPLGNSQVSADTLSELISCLHKTFIQLRSSSKNIDSYEYEVKKSNLKSSKTNERISKFKKHSISSREGVLSSSLENSNNKEKDSSDDSYLSIPCTSLDSEVPFSARKKTNPTKSKYDVHWCETVKNESSRSLKRSSVNRYDQQSGDTGKGRGDYNDNSITETEGRCQVPSEDKSMGNDPPSTTSTKQQTSKLKPPNKPKKISSSSSMEVMEKTSLDLIKELVKEYKNTLGKKTPTDEFSKKLMEIFTKEYSKLKRDSVHSCTKKTCKLHHKKRTSPCRNPDCKLKEKFSELDSGSSQTEHQPKCHRCNRFKPKRSLKAAFILCPLYKIPQMICPCHSAQHRHLYSQMLQQTQYNSSMRDTGGMYCQCFSHCASQDVEQLFKKPGFQMETTLNRNVPKPVAYNLIVEPASAMKIQNHAFKKKILPDVIVKVPKFGEWFDYFENDKMYEEGNKENRYKSESDASVIEKMSPKSKSKSEIWDNNRQPIKKHDMSSQYESHPGSILSPKSGVNSESYDNRYQYDTVTHDKISLSRDDVRKSRPYKGDCFDNTSIVKNSESSGSSEVSSQLTLQEHLIINRADFIKSAEHRRSTIQKNGQQRKQLADQMNEALSSLGVSSFKDLEVLNPNFINSLKPQEYGISSSKATSTKKQLYSEKEIKAHTLKIIRKLPEKQRKNEQIQKAAKQKANSIRAQIFKRKLQMKTLDGNVNIPIRTSVMAL